MIDTLRTPGPSRRALARVVLAAAAASSPLVAAGTARAAAGGRVRAGNGSSTDHDPRPRPAAVGALGDQSAVRTLKVGDSRFTYVLDGAMELDTAGFLPAVPASYWARHPQALTRSGRLAASVGGVLVERGRRKLLIDVGLGANVLSPSFGVSRGGALLRTLRALRVAPEEIDTVAFTHLHTDHTGLGFVPGRDGVMRKAFPRADYLVAALEWDPFWRREITVGAPSWDGFMVPMSRVLRRFDDGDEVWPGVTTMITPGHSPGHTTYVVSTGGGPRVLVLGDAFHTLAQVEHPEWPSGPDVHADEVLTARTELLGRLRAPRTLGFAYHFGDQTFGRVVNGHAGEAARWQPVPARKLLPNPIRL